ncbi:MAG: right-handed parallel beta-helix repeat-containing protein [Pseudomonadota bacterium]
MKKIKTIIFLTVILMSNIASAQVLESFEKPQLYTEPVVQLPSSIPLQESKNLFTIPNTNAEIDLMNICPVNDPNAIVADKADVIDKILFDNVSDPNSTYLINNSYYKFCFKIGNKKIEAGQTNIVSGILDNSIKFTQSSNENKPIIISGLEFKQDGTGLEINTDSFIIVHNLMIDKSKKGIGLNCPNGCMVVNSTLTGIPASPPAVSIGIKIETSKDVTIDNITISNFDIGIDAEGENILIKESSITNNVLYGIFAKEGVRKLSISKISLFDNGGGIEAEKAFMLEKGANSNIELIDSQIIKDKPTFILPQTTSSKDDPVRYVEIYDAGDNINQKRNQLKTILVHHDLKGNELIQKDDAITITDPGMQRKYVMVTFRGSDGSTRSTQALWTLGEVIITAGDIESEASPTGVAGFAGGDQQSGIQNPGPGGDENIDGLGGGMAGMKASACSLQRNAKTNTANIVLIILSFCVILYGRSGKKVQKKENGGIYVNRF